MLQRWGTLKEKSSLNSLAACSVVVFLQAAGVGEASGMFPAEGIGYNKFMIEKFRALIADKGYKWDIEDILPAVKKAGEHCGVLTESGAKFLDPEGDLKAGVPFCPPEGDAGTGMTFPHPRGHFSREKIMYIHRQGGYI